jgi:class 3 adenylate cyclase
VVSAMATAFGSAIACRRAAKFGVSPTTASSCAAPEPIKSPPTTNQASLGKAMMVPVKEPVQAIASLAYGEGTAMPETRKLAAILAADVAGYSKLAGADEERTLARLRALRSDLIDPTITLHRGRVVKRTGDGVLIEFRSVADAVRCACKRVKG